MITVSAEKLCDGDPVEILVDERLEPVGRSGRDRFCGFLDGRLRGHRLRLAALRLGGRLLSPVSVIFAETSENRSEACRYWLRRTRTTPDIPPTWGRT